MYCRTCRAEFCREEAVERLIGEEDVDLFCPYCHSQRIEGNEDNSLRNAVKSWKLLSAKIIKRDKQCYLCGAEKNLDVHHIIPFRFSKDDSEDNLITLCSKCHKTADNYFLRYGKTRKVREMINHAMKRF